MGIKFIGGKRVTVSTPHHIDEALEYLGETIKGNVVNPTNSQLFTITSEAKDIDYRLGNRGLFYTHKGEVPNRGILGEI